MKERWMDGWMEYVVRLVELGIRSIAPNNSRTRKIGK